MKQHNALWLASWLLLCAPGCAGHAVDLDRSLPPTGSAGAVGETPGLETTPVRSVLENFWADDSRIYWNRPQYAGGSNYGCVFNQCASTEVTYGPDAPTPSQWILPLGDEILFDRSDIAFRCQKTGCVGAPTQVLRGTVYDAVSDGTYLYWQSPDSIYRCSIANCGDIPELVAARVDADDLHVQGGNVYWKSPINTSAWILSAPSDGSQKPTTIVARDADGVPAIDANVAEIQGFTLDAERVYWLDSSSQVRACSIRGCQPGEPAVIPTDAEWKGGLLADATGLYWVGGEYVLRYCPSAGCKAGSAPKNISTGQAVHFQITPNYVYWSQNQPSDPSDVPLWLIYRTPKPNQ